MSYIKFGDMDDPTPVDHVLRLCTYNIHGWRDASHDWNIDRIKEYLADNGANVIALQEVYNAPVHSFGAKPLNREGETTLHYLCESLNFKNVVFGAAWSNFGNAIVSKYALESTGVHRMKNGGRETRLVCCALLKSPTSQPFGVFCTHLDHMEEGHRIVELNSALGYIAQKYPDIPHLLVGDFNSLTRTDYSVGEWNEIAGHRLGNSWEAPFSQVTDLLKSKGYKDVWASMNHVSGRNNVATCWANTRIDYIWASPDFTWKFKNCWRGDCNASDHFPVFVDIDFSD